MLKLKYLFVNFELAKECLKLYDYDKESLDEMLQYFRISSNAIYPFRYGNNPEKICFLRLSPAEEKPFSDVASEIRLIEWLVDRGFPAMRPLPMKNGNLSDQINTKWGIYNISCFEKVPGDSLEDTDGTLQIVKGYGETLGMLHSLMKEYPYPEERRDHKALFKVIETRLSQYHAPEPVMKEFAWISEELAELPICSDNYGVIHYDFEPDNVFYDEKTGTYSVIDFDDAIRCWYTLDVVRALDALDEVVEGADLKEAEVCFLNSYKNAASFTDEQLSELPLMRRLVHLQEYSTLLYVMSEPVYEKPEWMIALIEKLECKLKKLENVIANSLSI